MKKFKYLLKFILMLMLFLGINILLKYLFNLIFFSVTSPTSDGTYEFYINQIRYSIVDSLLYTVIHFIIDIVSLLLGYFITFRKQILLRTCQKNRCVSLVIGYFTILFFNISIITTWNRYYMMLFFDLSSFLLLGILLILTGGLYFMMYKQELFLKKRRIKSLFLLLLIVGIIFSIIGLYIIAKNLNFSYIHQYIDKLNINPRELFW